jgi:hypothetical protein
VIDFPASPTNGQIFNAPNGVVYQYSTTYLSWLAQSAAPGVGPYLPLTGGTLTGALVLDDPGSTAGVNVDIGGWVEVLGPGPGIDWQLLSAPTNQKNWQLFPDPVAYSLCLQAVNDAWGAPVQWTFARNGSTTLPGALTGTTATFSGGGFNGALKVTTNDSIIGGLFAGATKGVRIVPNAAYTAIEGVDNTGVGSYQPLTISGSVVNIAAPLSGTTATLSTAIAAGSNDTTVPTTAWCRANISGGGGSGKLLQTVYNRTGTGGSGTTIIPFDTTIPQITEGDEYMTLAVTPTSATSLLIIDVVWIGSNSAVNNMGVALFKDATASALTAAAATVTAANATVNIKFKYIMVSGSTAATTFRVRAGGGAAGTTSFNSGTTFGFVMCSSMTIQEVTP